MNRRCPFFKPHSLPSSSSSSRYRSFSLLMDSREETSLKGSLRSDIRPDRPSSHSFSLDCGTANIHHIDDQLSFVSLLELLKIRRQVRDNVIITVCEEISFTPYERTWSTTILERFVQTHLANKRGPSNITNSDTLVFEVRVWWLLFVGSVIRWRSITWFDARLCSFVSCRHSFTLVRWNGVPAYLWTMNAAVCPAEIYRG